MPNNFKTINIRRDVLEQIDKMFFHRKVTKLSTKVDRALKGFIRIHQDDEKLKESFVEFLNNKRMPHDNEKRAELILKWMKNQI